MGKSQTNKPTQPFKFFFSEESWSCLMDVVLPFIASIAMLPGIIPFQLAALYPLHQNLLSCGDLSCRLSEKSVPFISGCNWKPHWQKARWILKLASKLFLLPGIHSQRSLMSLLVTACWLEEELWEFHSQSYYCHHCLTFTRAWDLLQIPPSLWAQNTLKKSWSQRARYLVGKKKKKKPIPETAEEEGCNCKTEMARGKGVAIKV